MDTVDLPRRLKAARVLADLTVGQLAAKLDTPGFGAKTLGAIERGERAIRPHEIRLIADALEMPESFFTRPLGEPGPAGEDEVVAAMRRIESLVVTQADRVSNLKIEVLARIYERLDTIDRRLAVMDPSLTEERISTLEDQMETVIDVAIGRVGADLGAAAAEQRQEADEGDTGSPGKDRPHRRPGAEGR